MKTELILNTNESLELKTMQTRLLEVSKEKRQLQYKIECFINSKTVEIKTQKASTNYIDRDLQLIRDFLEKNGPSITRDICEYLDKALENEFKRWNPNNLKHATLNGRFDGFFIRYMNNSGILKDNKYWILK